MSARRECCHAHPELTRRSGLERDGISGRRECIRAGRMVRLVALALPGLGAMAGGGPVELFGVDHQRDRAPPAHRRASSHPRPAPRQPPSPLRRSPPARPAQSEEQDRLARQLDLVTARLDALDTTYEEARTHLHECLALAGDCRTVYACGSDTTRQMANQAFFTRIYLDADDTIRTEPTRSFGLLLDPDTQQQALSWADAQQHAGKRPTRTLMPDVEGSSKTRGVEPAGIEPATSSMPRKRAAAAPRPRTQTEIKILRAESVLRILAYIPVVFHTLSVSVPSML